MQSKPIATTPSLPASTLASPDVYAAIDMGSNSFRLEIAQLRRGQYKRLEYLKETVRLGGGLDAESMLSEAAMQRGLDCLQRFAERIKSFAPHTVRAVATQTLREARNRDVFLARAQTSLGFPIEVISGREEARLIYAGVARLRVSETPRLVIDIGGRSTEMILGHGRKAVTAESFQVGSVSLSMRFFPDGRFTPQAFRAAQVAAGAELEEALTLFSRSRWQEALGSSGTVSAVSQLLAASGITDGRITPAALRWCIEQCLAAGSMDKLSFPGLKEDRRAVVGGGLCILYTLLCQFGIDELLPTKGALRQGVVFDLASRVQAEHGSGAHDVREASIKQLQQRFGVDLAQAARVKAHALAIYKQLQPRASAELKRELGWAASVHELGMMVSHHDHHRHSAYLLAHVDAPGFSQNQLRRLGELALGQRGGLRKMEGQLQDESLLWQLLALRLAIIQCHARADVQNKAMRLARQARKVLIQMSPGWAATHPRALYLLQEEAQAWSRTELLALDLKA